MSRDVSLHEACYRGRLDVVARLLADGADPNEPADASERKWVSCAGDRPRPLNCVAIAWAITDDHLKIASLLMEHGATMDDSVLRDLDSESTGGAKDEALRKVFT